MPTPDGELSVQDFDRIIESLQFTRQHLEDYDGHPSYEFKRDRVAEVDETLNKARQHRRTLK